MYANYKRVRMASIERTIEDIKRHRRLVPCFRSIAQKAEQQGVIDPLSAEILDDVSVLSLVPCVLLSVFLCRFSELEFVLPMDLKRRKSLLIKQPKVKQSKRISTELFSDELKMIDIKPGEALRVVSYISLAKEIRRSSSRLGITMPDKTKSETHIFRHLFASWAKHMGVKDEIVSIRLGHTKIETLKAYQHPWYAMKSNHL